MDLGYNAGVSYNRKEEKDHGEGGSLVGAELKGQVILIDDVLTSGKAIRKSAELIEAAGASIEGIVIALDRKEKLESGKSAAMELSDGLKVPVLSLATVEDVTDYLQSKEDAELKKAFKDMEIYRSQFCLDP